MPRIGLRSAALILVTGVVVLPSAGSSTAHADGGIHRATTRHITAELVRTGVPYTGHAEARGVLTDDDPATGPLAGVEVVLYAADGYQGDGTQYGAVASTTTDADGSYTVRWEFDPYRDKYLIAPGELDQDGPDAVYADPGDVGWTSVLGHVSFRTAPGGRFTVRGGVAPRALAGVTIELYAGRPGREITYRGRFFLQDGAGVFGRTWRLAPGPWNLRLRYTYGDGRPLAPGTHPRYAILR